MFSALSPSTFKKTIKRLLGYVTLKYGHYTGQAVRTCQSKNFSCPTKPSDNDITKDPDGAEYWCLADCKEVME